jgi:hypothetical protein
MRKHATTKIDDKEFSVKELRVQDLLDILNGIGEAGGIEEEIEKWLPRCTDLTFEDLRKMAPSELMQVYEKFREVNADFFEIAGRLGLNQMAARMKESFMKEFSEVLSGSLKRVMPESGNTDIQHSV